MRNRLFYSICFGFVFGVLFSSFISLNFYTILLVGVVSLALCIFFICISKSKWGIVASIFLLAIFLGMLRFHIVQQSAPEVFESQVGQEVHMTGMIVDEPDIRENNIKLDVEVENDPLSPRFQRAKKEKTQILITTNFGEDFKYGDQVKVVGALEKPENFTTDQGKVFDYVHYLAKDGIYYQMSYPKIEIASHGHGSKIKSVLFSIKDRFLEKMNFAISPPESLLMGGLILGEKSSFDQALRQSFVNTGTIHIVALSGYNVTIVAEWLMKLFYFLPQRLGIGMGIFAVLLFVIMTGGSSTALRAGIMATLALIARAMGRTYDVSRALVLAGVLMLVFNPLILVYDVSFQLSFIATVAVIFLAPRMEKYFLWVTPRLGLRDIVSVTCAAYIFVLPYILYEMGNLSLVALPANILILPFIPFTMALGFITGFLGLIWHILALPFGFISYLFLHYELGVISFFSNLPFASFSIPNFPLILTLILYTYFSYILFRRSIQAFFEPIEA